MLSQPFFHSIIVKIKWNHLHQLLWKVTSLKKKKDKGTLLKSSENPENEFLLSKNYTTES